MKDLVELAVRNGVAVFDGNVKAFAPAPKPIRYAAMVELANLGFIANLEDLKTFTEEELVSLIEAARTVIGSDRDMTPIYPGFPKQVQELDTLTLLVEQIIHYWSFGTILPDHPRLAREGLPIEEMLKHARALEVLPVSAYSENNVERLVNAPIALSVADAELLTLLTGFLVDSGVSYQDLFKFAEGAANRENVQHYAQALISAGVPVEKVFEALGRGHLDLILRVFLSAYGKPSNNTRNILNNFSKAVSTLSDNNARSVAFKPIPRASRKVLMERVGELTDGFNVDRLLARRELWRRVFRSVHGFDYKGLYGVKRALDVVASNVPYRTFNSLVEEAIEKGNVLRAAELLGEFQPGNLLRRVVSLARVADADAIAVISNYIISSSGNVPLASLISAYNGILAANDAHVRVNRVAGANNHMLERELKPISEDFQNILLVATREAIKNVLRNRPLDGSILGRGSDAPVSLVERDASVSDRALARGERFALGSGNILRLFGHWVNNQDASGFMDVAAVALSETAEVLSVCDWVSWNASRDWATYSGDKLVSPGDEAAEFVDVNIEKLLKAYPRACFVAFTVQSWSGFPIDTVDFIAGVMVRDDEQAGEVFDARTVATAFHPTTMSLQSVPFVVDLESREMIWIDSSSGNTQTGVSSSRDSSISSVVYDEMLRPRLTERELVEWYAEALNVEVDPETPIEKDFLRNLLKL